MRRGGQYRQLSGDAARAWIEETLTELGERVRGQPDPIQVPTRKKKQDVLDCLDEVWIDHILPYLLEAGYTDDEESDLRNLAYEAVLNAVEHGNTMEAGTVVRVQAHVRSHGVLLAVTDEGDGFTQDDLGVYLDWDERWGSYRRGKGFDSFFSEAVGRCREDGFTLYVPWERDVS